MYAHGHADAHATCHMHARTLERERTLERTEANLDLLPSAAAPVDTSDPALIECERSVASRSRAEVMASTDRTTTSQ